jgi:DNA-binding response OmpR family regulator
MENREHPVKQTRNAVQLATILVIDDDKDILQALKEGLELPNVETTVHTSDNPITGLRVAKELRPDVVVLDLRMPQGSGFEFVKALKQEPSLAGTKVLMLTADSTRKNMWESVDRDIDDFLPKPFEMDELEARIKALLKKDRGTSLQI